MKKTIALLLVVALTAAIAIGGTMAYLTDTDEDTNVMTLGNVKIDQLEYERVDTETKNENAIVQEFHDNKPLYPAVIQDGFNWTTDANVDWSQIGKDGYTSGIWDPEKINNEQDKMVFVKNKGTSDAYVRSIFAFEANGYTLDQFNELFHLNINETDWTWEWVETPVSLPGAEGDQTTNYIVATATYNKVLKPGEFTEISLAQIALDPAAGNEDIAGFGETYQILVKTQAVQTQGFDNAEDALNKGFGEIATDNLPFENDSAVLGIDLRTALHYYEGNKDNQITKKVTNVIFGLNKDYPQVLDGYTGTLVDVEQDVPVYAYYVPNGSNYDVYFLASDTIYSPADSRALFKDMSSLQTVETENLDVSRTTNMFEMFRGCGKLTTMDVSQWDVSKVKNMTSMFRDCGSLPGLDTANWDTGSVRKMAYMFMNCTSLKTLDVSGWDLADVTDFYCMFYKCTSLPALDVSNWDTGSGTDMGYMFSNCSKLNGLDVSSWDVSQANAMNYMFYACSSLTELDVSNWDTGSATNMRFMFGYDSNLADLDMSDWDVSSMQNMSNMFYACKSIEYAEIGDWDVSNVTTFEGMYAECNNLKNVDMTNWQPSSVQSLYSMFYGCTQVDNLDFSGWNMPKLTTTSHMFADCNNLVNVDFTGWETPSLVSLDAMFNDCHSLIELDVSSFDTANCKEFTQIFEACWNLQYIKGLENWDTSNGGTFEQAFSGCGSLKELDLSGFNTRNAVNTYRPMLNGATGYGCMQMLSSMSSLEKLVISADFSFDGDGKVTNEGYKVTIPAPAAKAGFTAKWRNVETGELYLASEIPEETAATYVAYYEANSTT